MSVVNERYAVRPANKEEWEDAMALAWRTFKKYVADDYTDVGVKEFYDFISDNGIYKMFLIGEYRLWVALLNDEIVGMISIRTRRHISLLFVDGKHQRKGIGRDLIYAAAEYMLENGEKSATVNASPYGVPFYHSVGFVDTGAEYMSSGMRVTPMIWEFENKAPDSLFNPVTENGRDENDTL
ncbi:MAG: GNAT family N-acetyltransferase [Lachnospiraceae bacterium]|nr:GNAT family N-acetyltransferase [Lachnospiraceae bacterium]